MNMDRALELAKQGNPKAIAALLNRQLQPRGIQVKEAGQGGQLKLLLECPEATNKVKLTQYVIQWLTKLKPSIRALELYGKHPGQAGYAWQQSFRFADQQFTPIDRPKVELGIGAESPLKPSEAEARAIGMDEGGLQDVQALEHSERVDLARTGRLEAIDQFVRSVLADESDIVPFVELEGKVLKVTIQTTQLLNGPVFCGQLGKQLEAIGSEAVCELKIYKRKGEKAPPFLMQTVTLFHQPEPELRPNGESSAMAYPPHLGPDQNEVLAASRLPSSPGVVRSSKGSLVMGFDLKTYRCIMHFSQYASFLLPLAGLIVPIMLWRMGAEYREIDVEGKNIANWMISVFIYTVSLSLIILGVLFVGIPALFLATLVVAWVFVLAYLVMPLVATVRVLQGKTFKYPFTLTLLS